MVQVGDWVRIHEDATGFAPIPVVPVRVDVVRDDGSIYVDRPDNPRGGEEFFYVHEYDVVDAPVVEPDMISQPPHYKIKGDMEVIDVIEALAKDDAWYANAIKYLLCAKKKGKLTEDLGKCKFYIDRMLRDAESESK